MYKELGREWYDTNEENEIEKIKHDLEYNGCVCDYCDCQYMSDYNEKTQTWYCEKLDKEVNGCECSDNELDTIAEEIFQDNYEKIYSH